MKILHLQLVMSEGSKIKVSDNLTNKIMQVSTRAVATCSLLMVCLEWTSNKPARTRRTSTSSATTTTTKETWSRAHLRVRWIHQHLVSLHRWETLDSKVRVLLLLSTTLNIRLVLWEAPRLQVIRRRHQVSSINLQIWWCSRTFLRCSKSRGMPDNNNRTTTRLTNLGNLTNQKLRFMRKIC